MTDFNASTTFQKYCNPLVYPILARMLSFFEKLEPAIKDIIISHCIFDGKIQYNFLGPSDQNPSIQFSQN